MDLTLASLGLISLAICLNARRLGHVLGLLDIPTRRGRKRHRRVTPLLGGMAIMLPVLGFAVWEGMDSELAPLYLVFAASWAGFLALGLADDRRHVAPSLRLFLSVAICWLAIQVVPGLEVRFLMFGFLPHTLFLEGWSAFFTILCLVGLQNAINMADGKNGLVMGLSLFWTALLMVFAPAHMLGLLIVLFSALAVTLFFNLRGRLFLGDSGTYALGITMGFLSIYTYNVNFTEVPAEMVAIWFLIPVLDCIRLMVTRILNGRSPFSSDRNHLHHILLGVMPWRWALVSYLLLAGLPALGAAFHAEGTMLLALAATLIYVMVIVLRGGAVLARPTAA